MGRRQWACVRRSRARPRRHQFQNVDFNTTSYGGAGGVAFYPFGLVNSYSYPGYSTDLTASGDVFMNTQDQT